MWTQIVFTRDQRFKIEMAQCRRSIAYWHKKYMINEEMKDKKDTDERGRRKNNGKWCKVNKTNRKRNRNDDLLLESCYATCFS